MRTISFQLNIIIPPYGAIETCHKLEYVIQLQMNNKYRKIESLITICEKNLETVTYSLQTLAYGFDIFSQILIEFSNFASI